jgi:DNA-directed RNA polymerase subunit M/transcription elongation factor TFIIS
MASIMADSRPAGCEETHASIAASESSSSIAPKPIQSDTSSTQSQDQYEPIPNGRWTLTFTGNCPKCHHHNKALQVQIQVSPGVSHVTYVRCEKCRDRWAAFGGGNSTRISLLSTTTTEPDHVQQGVRYSFVEIVKLMQERAKSGPLPESHSLNTRSQPPVGAGIKNDASAAPSSLDASVVDLDAKDAAHAELEPCQRSIEPTNSLSTEHTLAPPKRRNNALRLLSNFKRKITTRFPILKRHRSRQIAATYQPESSIRKLEKSTIQTLPAEGPKAPPSIHVLPTVQCQTELSDNFAAEIVEPSKRIAEVVAFIATLDKSELNSMSEQERTAWMRRKYTEFKIHRCRVSSPLVVPTILQTSTQTEPLRPLFGQPSSDLFGVGYHLIEGLEVLESALRRGSFTISETSVAQANSTCSDCDNV